MEHAYTKWTHCPTCMNQQDHKHVPGEGWVCTKCKKINPNLRHGAAVEEVAEKHLVDDEALDTWLADIVSREKENPIPVKAFLLAEKISHKDKEDE